MKNLMEIESVSLGTMDTIAEYQRLFINSRVGEITTKSQLKTQRSKVINCHFENLEEMWIQLEDAYNCFSSSEYKVMILEDDFIAILN